MTISRRQRRVLNAIDGELSLDTTLARLTRLFTGPIRTPPDVWLAMRHAPLQPARTRPTRLFVVALILAVALGMAGTLVGMLLNIPVLGDVPLVVLLNTAIVFTAVVAIRTARRRTDTETAAGVRQI